MFEWSDRYSIGIKLIDEQHQELFRIASRTYALLRDKFAFDKYDRIIGLIEELRDYTIYHFNTEEKYMQEIRYKKLFSQKVEHADFVEKLNNLDLERIDENQDEYIENMLNFVGEWIINHILEKDKLIAAEGE